MKNLSVTEELFLETLPIDKLNDMDALKLILKEQIDSGESVKKIMPDILKVIKATYDHINKTNQSRLIYVGAGTSGRIGVQDAVELYPTFGWPKKRVDFIIAGGKKALLSSVENAEDNVKSAENAFYKSGVSKNDVVFGIAASGNTPFTCKVLELASSKNALTIAISNNPSGKILSFGKYKILLNTRQEVIAGSTRLKAGTSQKICLNIISTLLMVRLGFVKNGLMTNLIPNNNKLRIRQRLIKSDYASFKK